ncbi:hypothetical protein A2716_01880 [candidate division WWE3 bacterium RIFCSPHIGHO2_01_FULL_40_23]|uniref:Glycosyl transferase family 1 domain-containing protein n=1 Tax=candidate division WWE3 bacterium RIFCSPLOWO2_01_FULL_41_18 TaxID=1802625 RepID=A0A1F4VF03_UNCKA|nr:MAG: hypothetical protein A2716_01880 [candidate division WWE3 bacterium RIFCSPHIGHO2_01_FULL_40_23]OGC55739.1 MAG: hypothetical protein A3A78_01730 [candidate division WWE3 bacterium RIFCSPLOWO2_01_FULL_41_18]
MNGPSVALVHDYLIQNGGAERVLEAIHELFPDSVVFTSVFEKNSFPDYYSTWNIQTSGVSNLPFFNVLSKQYTFLYPAVFEAFDLSGFDIIISSWSAWSKAVLTKPNQLHISYCHTPPRFLYKYKGETSKRDAWYYKPFVSFIDNYLRIWDYSASQRPDFLISNSETVRKRIKKFYKRDSSVIYPPVKLKNRVVLTQRPNLVDTNYYLVVSRLAAYKNIDIAIAAFNFLGLPLRIVGTGKEEERLKKINKGNVAFLGRVNDNDLAFLYQNCKGVINPVTDEDFGIVPLEALSYGKPVLAHKSGGHLETIEDGKTGMLFEDLSIQGVIKAVKAFDDVVNANNFESEYLKKSVEKYDESVFKERFRSLVYEKWEEKVQTRI